MEIDPASFRSNFFLYFFKPKHVKNLILLNHQEHINIMEQEHLLMIPVLLMMLTNALNLLKIYTLRNLNCTGYFS